MLCEVVGNIFLSKLKLKWLYSFWKILQYKVSSEYVFQFLFHVHG
jgi:hypothetical protein